jgi:phosphatidylinositol alpha-mannosyltransferase
MKLLIREKRDCLLTIVGSGCLSPMLKILAESSSLKGNLKVKGQVDKKTLIRLYRKAHVFTLPSLFGEAFGITLLEAMASKTPVVATRQGGVSEIIRNGRTGILVRRGDAKKLAEALLTLLEDFSLAKKLAENAFKEAKKYDWNLIAERLEKEVYSQ